MKLYEINQLIEDCHLSAIDPETGEILDDKLDVERLEALELEKAQKIENVALWIKNLKSDIVALKAEKKHFEERARAAEKKMESLKYWLSGALNGEKFRTDKCSISFRRTQAVECENIDVVPDSFLRFKNPELDKDAIKRAIKIGNPVPGCKLAEKESLIIK